VKAEERRRLKGDKYADTAAKAYLWARAHRTPIIVAAAVVLAACGFALWHKVTREQVEGSARMLLREAEKKGQLALVKKAEERAAAVNDAVSRCDEIAVDYPETESAALALLQAGRLLALADEPERARGYFGQALDLAGERTGLAAQAQRGLAQTLEESGRFREALVEYRKLQEGAGAPMEAQLHWDVGRCHEAMQEHDLALDSYRKAVERGGDSMWAKLARFRIASLSSPGKPAPKGGEKEGAKPPAEGEDAESLSKPGDAADTGTAD